MSAISDIISRASAAVEDFRGDYEELAAVMRASWGESANPPYLYTSELLADCFRYPGAGFALAPAIYDGSQLVAFAAGLPRRVQAAGAPRRILISTFLSVTPARKSAGYGLVVWSEL